jgi:hypothetical protein
MEEDKQNWSATIFYALAWLVCSLLVIIDILAVREASLDVLTAIQVGQIESSEVNERALTQIRFGFRIQAIDQGFMFVGGIVAVVLAIGIEYYFRMGQKKGKLLQRVLQVIGLLVAVFVLCVVVRILV